jgi:outer membrane protein
MKTKFLLIFIFCSVSLSAQKKWSLKECINYALEHNISVQKSALDIETSEINLHSSKSNFLPNLNASAGHNWNTGLNTNPVTNANSIETTQNTRFGISASIIIYNGAKNLHQLHRANLALLASKYRLDDMKDNISLRIANAFLQVAFNKESLKTLKNQLILTKSDLNRSQELVQSGTIPEGDLLEIEANIANQELRIINSENSIQSSKITLANLLLIKNYKSFEISNENYEIPESAILTSNLDQIYNKAISTRNNIKALETNVDISKDNLKISKSDLLPTLSGSYGYSTRASQNGGINREIDPSNPQSFKTIGQVEGTGENVLTLTEEPNYLISERGPKAFFNQFDLNGGHSFGLSLNIPIFNRFLTRNSIKKSQVNLKISELNLEQSKIDLRDQVYQAYNDTQGALKSYEAAQKTLTARKGAYSYANEKFKNGLIDAFVLSQNKTQFENAQNDLIRAKYDYIFKLKILEFYFGIAIH